MTDKEREVGTAGERLVERVRITQSLLDDNEKLRAEIAQLQEAIRRLADQDATLSIKGGGVIVTMDATLTDEEREALGWGLNWLSARFGMDESPMAHRDIATLRRLLDRMK